MLTEREAGTTSGSRRLAVLAAGLLVAGLGLVVVPALVRDGVCGLLSCADQVPDIAVARTSPQELAVLVPPPAAADVSAVRLLEGSTASGAEAWLVVRDPAGRPADPPTEAFPFGRTPPGFRAVTGDGTVPTDGTWVAEVRFRCTVASVPFAPSQLAVGQVRSWAQVTDGTSFTSSAQSDERCATQAPGWERVLFWVGLLTAGVGAFLGIVVVFRRSGELADDEDAYRKAGWVDDGP